MSLKNKRFFSFLIIALMVISTVGITQLAEEANAATVNVEVGIQFTDTNGNVVHAHGGGMLKEGNYYYWLGENRDGTNLVSLYRSTDLKNWEFRSNLLYKNMGGELATANIERPKLLYNASTDKYVMWMHKENGEDYGEARVAVASADNIEGPYTYHGSWRPDGYDSRDMTVFNDNGTAYLFSSTRVNADMNIFRLNADFLGVDFDSSANYRIINRSSGKSLDVYQSSTSNGGNVIQWDYWGGNNQRWNIIEDGGTYRINNVASNKSLDVNNSSTANGGNVIQWDDWGTDNQRWDIVPVGNYWRIVNYNSGKSLDSSGAANGDNIHQWDYWGGTNQQWEIIKN